MSRSNPDHPYNTRNRKTVEKEQRDSLTDISRDSKDSQEIASPQVVDSIVRTQIDGSIDPVGSQAELRAGEAKQKKVAPQHYCPLKGNRKISSDVRRIHVVGAPTRCTAIRGIS